MDEQQHCFMLYDHSTAEWGTIMKVNKTKSNKLKLATNQIPRHLQRAVKKKK